MSAKEKTTGFLAEFRKFIARGNVMDLAVGVVVGGVGGGDQGSAQLCRGLPEEGVTHLPGGLLQASSQLSGLGSHVAPAHIEGDTGQLMSVHLGGAAPLGDEAADECFVPPGFLPPQLMLSLIHI